MDELRNETPASEQDSSLIYNKRQRLSYRSMMLLIALAVLALVGLNVAALTTADFPEWRTDGLRIALYGVNAAVLLALLALFVQWVYRPLKKIEKALLVFEEYGEDFSVNIDRYSEIYPVASSLNHIHSRMRESIDREYIAHMKQKDAEVRALQNQINPHFLYNTLDAIRGLALINGDDPVADMTEALSTFFRYSIGQKGHIVTLRDELENIRCYLVIQNNRFKNKLSFQVQIQDEEADWILDCRLPKLLLQPVIENAVYHGIEPKVGPGHITMRIFTTQDTLVINIQDDGIGMEEEELQLIREKLKQGRYGSESLNSRGSGIALININQRIILNYGERYGITVSSTKGIGSEVEMELPIIHERGAV